MTFVNFVIYTFAILIIVVMIGALYLAWHYPIRLARHRLHPHCSTITACNTVALVLFLLATYMALMLRDKVSSFTFGGAALVLWMTALIWAHLAEEPEEPEEPEEKQLPAESPLSVDAHDDQEHDDPAAHDKVAADAATHRAADDAPPKTTFRLTGVDRLTGDDVQIVVEALSQENAKIKGEFKGITVTNIEVV